MTGIISRKAVGVGRLAAGVLVFVLGMVWADPVGLAAWHVTGEAEERGAGQGGGTRALTPSGRVGVCPCGGWRGSG